MINVTVPDGRSGAWEVQTFTVGARSARMAFHPEEYVPPGTYKRLIRGGRVVMSNTPMEERTHRPIIRRAHGQVLINGLGLGMVLTAILEHADLESVTVIEQAADVISLVAPTFAGDDRVQIIHSNAFLFKPPAGTRYDAVWHDIWDDICADNLHEMKALHRRYGRRAVWQGSWARELCESHRRRRF